MTLPTRNCAFSAQRTNAELLDDHSLVARILAGETSLYETIMRRYNQRLFRIARSILFDDALAEDAVQEAYVAAYYALERYQPNGSFAAWLTRIAINEARMSKRKRTRRTETPLTELERSLPADIPQAYTNPDEAASNHNLAHLIATSVEQLPESFRLVFVMRGIQQLSVADTATTLQIPAATVKTRYHRARNLMQESLEPYLTEASMSVYEFAGQRCDNMVASVFKRLGLTQ